MEIPEMREEKLQDNSQRQHAMLEMETPEMRKRDFRTFPSVGILCYSWKLLTRGKRDSMTRRYAMLQLETPDKREERVKEKQLEMRKAKAKARKNKDAATKA